MAEMRDAGDRWESVDSVEAACGVKILATGLDRALGVRQLDCLRKTDSKN